MILQSPGKAATRSARDQPGDWQTIYVIPWADPTWKVVGWWCEEVKAVLAVMVNLNRNSYNNGDYQDML